MRIFILILFSLGAYLATGSLHDVLRQTAERIPAFLGTSPALVHANTVYKELLEEALVPQRVLCKCIGDSVSLEIFYKCKSNPYTKFEIFFPCSCIFLRDNKDFKFTGGNHYAIEDLEKVIHSTDRAEDSGSDASGDYSINYCPSLILRLYPPRHTTTAQFSQEYLGFMAEFGFNCVPNWGAHGLYQAVSGFDVIFDSTQNISCAKLITLFLPVAEGLQKFVPSAEDLFEEFWSYQASIDNSVRSMALNGDSNEVIKEKIRDEIPNLIQRLAKWISRVHFNHQEFKDRLTKTFSPDGILYKCGPVGVTKPNIERILKAGQTLVQLSGGIFNSDAIGSYDDYDSNYTVNDIESWTRHFISLSWTRHFISLPVTQDNFNPSQLIIQSYWDLLQKCIKQEYENLVAELKAVETIKAV